jgi:hypothetical protein
MFLACLPAGSSAGRDCRCTVGWRGQRKSTVALMCTVVCNFGGDAFVYRSVTLRYRIAVKCLSGLESVSQCCSFHDCPSSLLPMGRSDARPSAGSVSHSALRLSDYLQGMNCRHSVARSMSAPTGFSQWAEAMLALEENRWGNFQCDHQIVDLTSYVSSRYSLHTRAAGRGTITDSVCGNALSLRE